MYSFKKIILIAFANLFLISCSVTKPVTQREEIVYTYIDSLRIKDSTVVIPIEKVVDIVPQYDTLKLSTSLAESKSWVDTSLHLLRGSIANKKGITEHIIYKDRIIQRDSLIYKEVPVEVIKEVPVQKYPKWHRFLLIYYVITMLYFTYKIGRRFKFF